MVNITGSIYFLLTGKSFSASCISFCIHQIAPCGVPGFFFASSNKPAAAANNSSAEESAFSTCRVCSSASKRAFSASAAACSAAAFALAAAAACSSAAFFRCFGSGFLFCCCGSGSFSSGDLRFGFLSCFLRGTSGFRCRLVL